MKPGMKILDLKLLQMPKTMWTDRQTYGDTSIAISEVGTDQEEL